jgi:hypothetical protein
MLFIVFGFTGQVKKQKLKLVYNRWRKPKGDNET